MPRGSESIELKPLNKPEDVAASSEPAITVVDGPETTSAERWAWVTASILTLFALPLLVTPKMFLLLSNVSVEARTYLTPLESFLATHLGMGLLCLSLGLILGTPTPPALSTLALAPPPTRHPLLVPTSIVMLVSSLVSYNSTKEIGSLGTLVAISSGLIGIWGSWVILFADSGSYSKKTGADKHTSRFLFGNKAAASSIKEAWRKEHEKTR